MKNTISVVVLVEGHENPDLLKKCLSSVSWADEVLKIETKNIGGSFSEWRNYGLNKSKSKSKWVLYIDTDEVVTPELRSEISQLINKSDVNTGETNQFVAYAIPRKNLIFGREFRHSGQYPDYQKRLFFKEKFYEWKGELHEEPLFNGTLGHLKSPIMHYKNISIAEMVQKTNKWSDLEARLMFEANHPPMNIFRFASAGFREFWLRMILQVAFMDGTEGVIYALYQVYSRLISYSKLWEIQLMKGVTT